LGLISKITPSTTASYYHYDFRGSAIALTDQSGNITDKYAYEPFGKLANSDGATNNPFKYVGRYGVMDEGNGLNFIRARYYAPELGRFITKDPLSGNDKDGQSLNRYVYALNNPVIFIDADGEAAITITAALLFVGKFVLNVAATWATDKYILTPIMERVVGTKDTVEIGKGAVKDVSVATISTTASYIHPGLGIVTEIGLPMTEHLFLRAHKVEAPESTLSISGGAVAFDQYGNLYDMQGRMVDNMFSEGHNTPIIPETYETKRHKSQTFKK